MSGWKKCIVTEQTRQRTFATRQTAGWRARPRFFRSASRVSRRFEVWPRVQLPGDRNPRGITRLSVSVHTRDDRVPRERRRGTGEAKRGANHSLNRRITGLIGNSWLRRTGDNVRRDRRLLSTSGLYKRKWQQAKVCVCRTCSIEMRVQTTRTL